MASFNNLDTLRQMGLISLIYNGNHQLCLKFSCAGTGITFTGSMDSVVVIAATKQQMTVDNIGLQGMVGPMGGMMTEYVPPALPTVSMFYAYPNQIWNYSVNIGAGASSVLRDQNGNALSYDSTKSYSALNYYTSASDSAGTIATNVSIGASGSFLALFNNGSGQITVQRVNVATCADSTSTVITVYDSRNNPYNAFQYTSDGTDYYYVLDGTQTDWTDDLASIGYHMPVLVTSYLTNSGASATTNFGLGPNSIYQLYDSSGSMLLYDSTKTYSIISANRIDSQYPDWSSSDLQSLSIGHYSHYLHLVTGGNIPYQNGIYSVTFTIS